MEIVEEVQGLQRLNRIQRVRIRDSSNPMEELDDDIFRSRFRFHKETVSYILQLVIGKLCSPVPRGGGVPPIIQLLAALRFYATGMFQVDIGDLRGLTQPTVCRIVKRVSRALAELRPHFVQFPDAARAEKIKREFRDIAGFPGKFLSTV